MPTSIREKRHLIKVRVTGRLSRRFCFCVLAGPIEMGEQYRLIISARGVSTKTPSLCRLPEVYCYPLAAVAPILTRSSRNLFTKEIRNANRVFVEMGSTTPTGSFNPTLHYDLGL